MEENLSGSPKQSWRETGGSQQYCQLMLDCSKLLVVCCLACVISHGEHGFRKMSLDILERESGLSVPLCKEKA
jgi:hypothetical protein